VCCVLIGVSPYKCFTLSCTTATGWWPNCSYSNNNNNNNNISNARKATEYLFVFSRQYITSYQPGRQYVSEKHSSLPRLHIIDNPDRSVLVLLGIWGQFRCSASNLVTTASLRDPLMTGLRRQQQACGIRGILPSLEMRHPNGMLWAIPYASSCSTARKLKGSQVNERMNEWILTRISSGKLFPVPYP
jgi:hypothetical protein